MHRGPGPKLTVRGPRKRKSEETVRFYGRTVGFRRLAIIFAAPIALLIAAWLVLPGSILRLVLLGLIALPVALYLIDRPEIVFYMFTFVIFSNVDVYSPIPIFQSMAIFVMITIALAIIRGRKIAMPGTRFIFLLGAFVLLSFQSLAVARDLGTAIDVFEKFIGVIVCVLISSQFVNNRRQFRIFLLVMVAAIVVNNLLPLFVPVPQDYAGPALIGSQGVLRFQGLILEPNAVAFLQIFCIPFYLFLAGVYKKPLIARWVFIGALLVSLVVIVMSFSRGSLLAFALLLLLLLYSERRNKTILITGIVLIVIAVSLVPSSYIVRVKSIFNALSNPSMDYPIYTRLVTSRVAMQIAARHPITGVGMGNFMHHAPHYTSFPLVVHNVPLLIFSELGILALGVFVAMVVVNMKILLKLAGWRDDPEASLLGRMLLLQQMAVLVNALFLPALYDHSFWYMLALPTFAAFAYRSSLGESK